MLQTQVAYWANKENARHNLVTESQTDKDLKRKEAELDQTIRYQTEQVQYWKDQLSELTRHNKATESLTAEELQTKRDQAKAALQQAEAALKNAETNRRDLSNRAISANAAAQQAAAASKQAETSRQKANQDIRESASRVTQNRAEIDRTKQETELKGKQSDHYIWKEVILPTVKTILPW